MTEKPTYEELEKRDKELEKEPSKLKQAEKKARLMQYCVDNASDAVFWVDNKAHFTYVNKAACRHMGYSREKLLSMKVHDVDPLYQKDNWPDFWREFKGKGSLLFESINRRKDGKEFPVEITVNYLEQDGTEIMHAYVRDITERQRAEGALRESEARYMAMFENMSNGVAVYKAVNDGEDFIFIGFNKAGEKIEKINKEDLIGKSVLEVFPGVKDFGLFEAFQRVWATGKSEDHPVAMYKDQRISGWRENFVYRLSSGEIVALYSDETKRKQAEETAKLAYAELDQIFQTAGGGMRVVDKDFNVLRINQTFATLSGKTEAQAVGRKCYEGFPGPACHTSQCPLSRILGGVERAEYEAEKERSDGTKVPCIITATPFKGPSGELIGIVEDFKDITERKQAEEVLRDSEERYRKIVDTAQEGIYVVDTEVKIGFVNKQMAQMLGYSVEEMDGRHLIDFMDDIAPVETYRDFHWDKQEMKTPHDFRFRRKDGSELWGMISSSSVYDNKGKFVGALGMVVDITERKEAERALRKANDEQKAFIDIVSHDLKNPIFSIRGFSRLLLRNYEKQLGDKGRGYLDLIDASACQMDRLVSDLLALSRLGEVVPNLRSVIFHQIIDKAVSTFQGRLEEMGIELVVGQNLPIIYCDGERMYEVFENLLSNAIRFARNAEKPKIEIGYEDEGEYHRFYVRDNGVGIDQKHHRRIFQMFQRVTERGNEEGTGLGLAIVDRIVRQHGGEVWVESEKGKGATFHFTLQKAP